MDKESLPSKTHAEAPPPKKKRRLVIKTSFDVLTPSKRPRPRALGFATSFAQIPARPGHTGPSEQCGTPMRVLKPPRLTSNERASAKTAAQDDHEQSPSKPHRKLRVSAPFSDFVSTFDLPVPPSKPKPRPEIRPSGLVHVPQQSTSTVSQRPVAGEGGGGTADGSGTDAAAPPVTRTPMRVLKPPSFTESIRKEKQSLPKSMSPLLTCPPHLRESTATPDAKGKTKISTMTSHLPYLNDAVSRLASPKGKPAEIERKLITLAPPVLRSEPQEDSNEGRPTFTSSTVTHSQRAEILANAARDPRKNQPTDLELAELSRGLELSPPKSGKEHGQKFIKGGFAERAEHLLSRSSTNFSLWQAGFIRQIEGSKHPKEDLRLHIVSIVSYTRNPGWHYTSSEGPPRSAIATCREVLADAQEEDENKPQEGTVVFLFSGGGQVSSASNFKEGRDVCVWRPWQEIDMPEASDLLRQPAIEIRTPPNSQGSAGRRTALLCSRFLVLT